MRDSTLDIARSLAAQDLRVFPCSNNKTPTITHPVRGRGGFHAASNSPEVIEAHWRYFYGSRVGYPTGEANGIDVLDIDEKLGGEFFLADNWHRLPRTFMYRTGGNGGWHLQFLHHPGQRSVPQGRIWPGVEIKTTGGYAIAWWAHGSFVLDDSPPAPWPEWLVALVPVPAPFPLPARRANGALRVLPARRLAGAICRIEDATKGERHALIHWGGRIVGLMAADGEIEDLDVALVEIAEAGVRAGKDEREAYRTARDGAKMVLRNV